MFDPGGCQVVFKVLARNADCTAGSSDLMTAKLARFDEVINGGQPESEDLGDFVHFEKPMVLV